MRHYLAPLEEKHTTFTHCYWQQTPTYEWKISNKRASHVDANHKQQTAPEENPKACCTWDSILSHLETNSVLYLLTESQKNHLQKLVWNPSSFLPYSFFQESLHWCCLTWGSLIMRKEFLRNWMNWVFPTQQSRIKESISSTQHQEPISSTQPSTINILNTAIKNQYPQHSCPESVSSTQPSRIQDPQLHSSWDLWICYQSRAKWKELCKHMGCVHNKSMTVSKTCMKLQRKSPTRTLWR
jgi:hypothetical protein